MHGDLAYPVKLDTLGYNYYPIWDQHPSISNFDELDRVFIMVPTIWLAHVFHLGVGVFSRLFSFSIALIGALGIVYCKRVLLRLVTDERLNNRVIWFTDALAVVIFSFNPWVIYQVEAPFFQMAYAFLPWLIAMQLRYLLGGGLLYLAGAVIAWTLASGSPQYTIFSAAFSFAIFIVAIATNRTMHLRQYALRYAAILVGYALVNLHWIGAFIEINKVATLTPGYALRWADVQAFSSNSTLYNVLTGLDVWVPWWKEFNTWAVLPIESVAAPLRLVPLFVSVLGIWLAWRTPYMRFAAIALVLLVVLLQGASGPFQSLYQFLVFHAIPGYGWVIRSPEKFGAYLWFLYATTGSVGLALLARFGMTRFQVAGCAAIALTLIGMLPVMKGTLFLHYVPVPIPDSYLQAWDYLKHRDGKVLVLADYEDLARYSPGDVVFRWAPANRGGSTISRSFPLPTFGVYHFTNPFAYFYSMIKSAGPDALPGFAAVLSTNYVVLERDIVGDERWFQDWRQGLLKRGFIERLENADFALFELPGLTTSEARSGPYVMYYGDADGLTELARRFGPKLDRVLLISGEQGLGTNTVAQLAGASAIVTRNRSALDVALESFSPDRYLTFEMNDPEPAVLSKWVAERVSYRYEEYGGFWGAWSSDMLKIPQVWPYDLGKPVLFTSGRGATYSIKLPPRSGRTDLYVRYLAFDGSEAPTFAVTVDGKTVRIVGRSPRPTWEWARIATIAAYDEPSITLTALAGAPAVNTILAAPEGEVQRRLATLQTRKLIDISKLSLRSMPMATIAAPAAKFPYNVGVDGDGGLMLTESYDPYWFAVAGEKETQARAAWGYGLAFAPVAGDTRLRFVPEESLDRWMRIEVVLLAVIIPISVGLEFWRRRRNNAA